MTRRYASGRRSAHDSALVARRWQSDVPFVGRATELDVLSNLAAISVAGPQCDRRRHRRAGDRQVATRRRGRHHDHARSPDTFLLEGVCAPYGESNVWWPVAGGLLARLGLDRNSLTDESRARVIERLESYDGVAVRHARVRPRRRGRDASARSSERARCAGADRRARCGLRRPHVRARGGARHAHRSCSGSTTCNGRHRCCSTCSSRSPATWSTSPS